MKVLLFKATWDLRSLGLMSVGLFVKKLCLRYTGKDP